MFSTSENGYVQGCNEFLGNKIDSDLALRGRKKVGT